MGFAALSPSYETILSCAGWHSRTNMVNRWTGRTAGVASVRGPGRPTLAERIFGRYRLRRINTGFLAGIKIFSVGIPQTIIALRYGFVLTVALDQLARR
jgi:hypothetical protein